MPEKSLYEMLIDAGYPESKIYSHESDLYVYITPVTDVVVEKWCKKNGSSCVSVFRDQITGKLMYDCAFQYLPYWKRRSM